jgi:dihydrofolate reductase
MISLIWAMDERGTIGLGNGMPWHLPNDLAYFKRVTQGHTVVMGRKTFESIGKPLPGRRNVVLTRDREFQVEGCMVVHSLEDVPREDGELFVVGGAKVYGEFLPLADRLYVTRIRHEFAGDAFFPEVDWSKWRLVSAEEGVVDEKNRYPHVFEVYERV